MKSLSIFYKSVKVSLDTGPNIRDITPALEQLIDDLRVENGRPSNMNPGWSEI
jgi:hypothetical protein